MQTTRHTTLFTHPQITPITQIKLCVSARETLTADYTDYTDKLCGSARGYCPQITPITLINSANLFPFKKGTSAALREDFFVTTTCRGYAFQLLDACFWSPRCMLSASKSIDFGF